MKLREFLNTCQNEWTEIDIYLSSDSWDEWQPDYTYVDMRDIPRAMLNTTIDAWEMDANFKLHISL